MRGNRNANENSSRLRLNSKQEALDKRKLNHPMCVCVVNVNESLVDAMRIESAQSLGELQKFVRKKNWMRQIAMRYSV